MRPTRARIRPLIGGLGLLALLCTPASAPGVAPERRTTLGCLELEGVIGPSREVDFRCQLSARLDGPIDEFIRPENLGAADSQPHTRVGVVNLDADGLPDHQPSLQVYEYLSSNVATPAPHRNQSLQLHYIESCSEAIGKLRTMT